MALKRKSTLAQNPLGFGSSSFDTPPLHVQLYNGKAQHDFLENCQRRGVHSKCHVILLDFFDTPLPHIVQTKDWESLCEIPLRSCLYRNFTPTYIASIPLYLGLSRYFEVHIS